MEEFEIAIIGGGPAGMMAAITCREKNIVLIEKTSKLGKKLLLTGGGRCNITNNKPIKTLLNYYEEKNFLKHSFYTLTNEKLLDLFKKKGLEFIEEDNNSIFPATEKAESIMKILHDYLKNIKIKYNTNVYNVEKKREYFIINNKIKAKKIIIATGGITYPETGSDGGGYNLTNQPLTAIKWGIVPLITKYHFEDFAGINLYDVCISYKDKKYYGDVLITHKGLSGPAILNISNEISKDIDYNLLDNNDIKLNDVKINIDLLPNLNFQEIKEKFNRDFQQKGKTYLKNYLKIYLVNNFIPFFLDHNNIDGEIKLANITKESKKKLIESLKCTTLKIIGFNTPLSKITIGGIDINSLNSKTMESKETEGLYFAGEILEPVGPSGGYNLKIAFSTGYLAGISALKSL